MKKSKILLGLGAMTLLTSCGPKLITDTAKISDLKTAIAAKKDEVKNYWMSLTGKTVEVDKVTKEKITKNDEMLLRSNEDGEKHLHMTNDGGAVSTDYYLVNDETYEKLIYCDSDSDYDGIITVIDRKTHKKEFDEFLVNQFEPKTSFADAFLDPYKLTSFVGMLHNDGQRFNTDTKHYSGKDGQLTIKINETSVVEGDDTTNQIEANYEDYVFKGMTIKHSYSTEQIEWSTEITVDFKKMNKVTIALPSNWESHLYTLE